MQFMAPGGIDWASEHHGLQTEVIYSAPITVQRWAAWAGRVVQLSANSRAAVSQTAGRGQRESGRQAASFRGQNLEIAVTFHYTPSDRTIMWPHPAARGRLGVWSSWAFVCPAFLPGEGGGRMLWWIPADLDSDHPRTAPPPATP